MTVILTLVLIGLGILMRLMPHNPNYIALFSPVALALFAGARLPKRMGWLVPALVMVVTDLAISWNTPYRSWLWSTENVIRYATVLACVGLGRAAMRLENPLSWVTVGFASSVLFFLVTNFAVWAFPAGMAGMTPYPRSIAGLMECYTAALPYFRNTLQGDLSSTLVLFGADFVARWLLGRTRREAALETIPVRDR